MADYSKLMKKYDENHKQRLANFYAKFGDK